MMQSTSHVLLIRPAKFGFNRQTAVSNFFQKKLEVEENELSKLALVEFDSAVSTLRANGINVTVVDDTENPEKPDAIFPNNWISLHPDGTAVLYPMQAQNRRTERRKEIIELLKQNFEINQIKDFSVFENENRFLEGTGSIVFDHVNKIAYACLSPRTDKELLLKLCSILGYKPCYFHAWDKTGNEIYHTNVMMCIGEKFAVICLDAIKNKEEKTMVSKTLSNNGLQIIEISLDQMENFAGNMLHLKSQGKKNILTLSQSAFNSLGFEQKHQIEQYCVLVPLSIPTIETIGGGSARCMIAEIFLQPR